MKTLIAVSLLVFGLLGVMTGRAAAQASGPTCLHIVELEEIAQFFSLPTPPPREWHPGATPGVVET